MPFASLIPSRQYSVQSMNDTIGRWYIRGDHLCIVDLYLAGGCLLQHHRLAGKERILDLVETHASREQCTGHNVLHGKLFSSLLVRVQFLQRIRIQFAEALVHRCEYSVCLDPCWRDETDYLVANLMEFCSSPLTLALQFLRQSRGVQYLQEVGEATLAIRLQCLQQISHWQWEHDTIHRMRNTLWYLNVLLVKHNHCSVNCGQLGMD